jgi:hypothetical protein
MNYALISITKYGGMLSCQDSSPHSSANPLPDDSIKPHQLFDFEQVCVPGGDIWTL